MGIEPAITAVRDYLEHGGFVMPPLVLVMLALWYALGVRLQNLRRGNRRSVRVLVEHYCGGYPRPPGGVIDGAVVAGLAVVAERPRFLRQRLDEAFGAFAARIARHARLVKTLVMVAPLLGLLGTVSGMIETFTSLGEGAFASQTGGISGGISEALYSTQFGLTVAIPGMLLGRILARKQHKLELELGKLKDILCSEARGRSR